METAVAHDILSRKISAKINVEAGMPQTPVTSSIQVYSRDIPLPPSPQALFIPAMSVDVVHISEENGGRNGRLKGQDYGSSSVGVSPRNVERFKELEDSTNQSENGDAKVVQQFRIEKLMKDMAEKEASQRRIIEQQFIQIADLQKTIKKLKEGVMEGDPYAVDIGSLLEDRDTLVIENTKQSCPIPPPASSPHSKSLASDTFTLDRLRDEHAAEREALITDHSQTIDMLQLEFAKGLETCRREIEGNQVTINSLRARIESLEREHDSSLTKWRQALESKDIAHHDELESLKTMHSQVVISLQTAHTHALETLQAEQDVVSREMESSLSENEEQRRQLKMKADQALFELSRIQDERAVERDNDAKQKSELRENNVRLENIKVELEHANAEWMATCAELTRRNSELEQKSTGGSRKMMVVCPPQGPPPTVPLPPVPQGCSVNNALQADVGRGNSIKLTVLSEQEAKRQSESSTGHGHSEIMLNEAGAQVLYAAVAERDGLKREMEREKEMVKEIEAKLQEEKVKVNNLALDLRATQKMANNLRAHLDEARQETKRSAAACREHTAELEARREQMSEISQDQRSQRDSLQAAQAQVASLKMQLERAVDKKVAKKGLRCF